MEPNTQNALNPTATNVYIPQDGVFRATDGTPTIYKVANGSLQAFDLTSLLTPQEKQQLGNNTNIWTTALQKAQQQYGFDFNSLPSANLADTYQSLQRQGLGYTTPEGSYVAPQTQSTNINDFLNQQVAKLQQQAINTTPNTLSPNAKQPVNNQTPPTLQPSTANVSQAIPSVSTPSVPAQTYTIQAGDTLGKLAQTYGTTVGALMSLNPQITDANKIYTGQKLNLTAPQTSTQQTGGLKPTDQAPQSMVDQANAIQAEIQKLTSPANTGQPTQPKTQTGQTETTNIIDTWSKVSQQLGLSDIKTQYNKTLDESKALQDKKNDEASDISNNPWYSEGKRQMELKKLDSKYETKLNTLSNYAKLYDSMYQEGLATAKFLTTGIQQDQQFALELAQKKQDALDALAKDNTVVSVNGREVLVNKSTGKVVADLGASKVTSSGTSGGNTGVTTGLNVSLDRNSPEYFTNLMSSTAGRKAPNQIETLRPIQKSMSVLSQLDALSQTIAQTKTDPVIGYLKTLNPYDFDARAVQAQLQALVPNLARGVYGEVGVLTDQDVRNYIQTLPNIKSTAEQNKFVTAMTMRTVQRNLESQLETLASAGYDISGFQNQYQRMLDTVKSVESTIGVNNSQSGAKLSPEDAYAEYLKVSGGSTQITPTTPTPNITKTSWQSMLPDTSGGFSLNSLFKI